MQTIKLLTLTLALTVLVTYFPTIPEVKAVSLSPLTFELTANPGETVTNVLRGTNTEGYPIGITIDGTKVPLGIWLGSTENAPVCTALLQNLLERGLRIDESILCVIDGGKGIRKALLDVVGDLAVIQRCQLHKLRNLRSYLPKSRHAYVLQTMKQAYKSNSAKKARKRLQALVSWLERNGYDEAAGSLSEGMEETLTVLKLALPELLRKSLATTNAIENLNGTIRRVSRNVKRWKSPSMIRRWTALGVVTAEKKFHRIKGYRHMGALVHALRSKQKSLDSNEFAA